MNPNITVRKAHVTAEGAGAEVARLMPVPQCMNYDPFVLWDHFHVGAGAGFPDHPHRGFEAITYMFEGGMQHADNLGNKSTVLSGGAQRFTAGRGIVHSEMPAEGSDSIGIQLWINLPRRLKTLDPAYQQVNADEFPEATIDGGRLRVIVGEGSPLKLHTPVRYLDLSLDAGASYSETVPAGDRGIVYVVEGRVDLAGQQLEQGEAGFFEHLADLDLTAAESSRLMIAYGRPHGEPIKQWGPYVD